MSAGRLSILRRDGGCYSFPTPPRLRVTGSDRVRYLNGQLSQEIRTLQAGRARAALLLTAKGKLCALVRVWIDDDSLVVEADGADEETLRNRLERYAIADDVAFVSAGPETTAWHVFGPAASEFSGLRVDRIGGEGCDLSAPPDGPLEASAEEVELLRLERGVPRWGRELDANSLPQEAGLDRFAVDFHKGCYVGQEVVSRLRSVGKVNRELAGLVGPFDPARAAVITTGDGHRVGSITSALAHPELNQAIALGYLSTRITASRFVVCDESGACLGSAERSEFPLVSA